MWGRLKERDVVHLYYCGSATSTVMLGGKSMVEVGLSDVLTFALIYGVEEQLRPNLPLFFIWRWAYWW